MINDRFLCLRILLTAIADIVHMFSAVGILPSMRRLPLEVGISLALAVTSLAVFG